jgi:hypothetical protein
LAVAVIALLAACTVEQGIVADPPAPADPPVDTAGPSVDTETTPPTDTPVETGSPPVDTGPAPPRAPASGDLVIAELMIDPSTEPDEDGEWIELVSTAAERLDWSGLSLADDGVDDTPVVGGGVLQPGGRRVLCAYGDRAANGGAK